MVDCSPGMLTGVLRQRAEGSRGHWAQAWELVFFLDLEI